MPSAWRSPDDLLDDRLAALDRLRHGRRPESRGGRVGGGGEGLLPYVSGEPCVLERAFGRLRGFAEATGGAVRPGEQAPGLGEPGMVAGILEDRHRLGDRRRPPRPASSRASPARRRTSSRTSDGVRRARAARPPAPPRRSPRRESPPPPRSGRPGAAPRRSREGARAAPVVLRQQRNRAAEQVRRRGHVPAGECAAAGGARDGCEASAPIARPRSSSGPSSER